MVYIVHRQSPSGPVDPSFRALYGRLKFTARRLKFDKDSLSVLRLCACSSALMGFVIQPDYRRGDPVRTGRGPQKALRGGIPGSFLEPLGRSWSHFVGIYRQKLTRSLEN